MNLIWAILNPTVIGLIALLLSVLWMLRNEKDRTRPILVFALVLNLFYGWLLTILLGKADGLLPWKYDLILNALDRSLGVSAASIALPLQGAWRMPLRLAYQLMIPMMILWYLLSRTWNVSKSLILAYAAELVAGPLFYAIVPACGPVYAFGSAWLHSPQIKAHLVRLNGMPNAFPSLHVATALVLMIFARGTLWRLISVSFLAITALATLATGEHYVIDLVSGFAFGAFAASSGFRLARPALSFFATALSWSLATRFGYGILIADPALLRVFVLVTLVAVSYATLKNWRAFRTGKDETEAPNIAAPAKWPRLSIQR